MNHCSLTLDHVALVAPDLGEAERIYARMGFNLSPRSSHKGRERPDGPVVPWGTGNHCAMFGQGYFEVLGITDPDKKCDHLKGLLDDHRGLHLIALGCRNIDDEARRLAARLGRGELPYRMSRDVPLPDGSSQQATFNLLHLPEGTFPEADLFFIQHQNPEVIWHPDTLQQRNGVIELESVTVCSTDVADTSRRLSDVLTVTPESHGQTNTFNLHRGCVHVITPGELAQRYPGIAVRARSWVAAVSFVVHDLRETCAFLERRQFCLTKHDGDSVWIGAEQAGGAIVEFAAR